MARQRASQARDAFARVGTSQVTTVSEDPDELAADVPAEPPAASIARTLPAPVLVAPATPMPVTGPPPRPPKPVRFTLDLDPELHRFLKRFALDTSADASAVVRALLVRLRDDPALAQQVQAAIWAAAR
jgi:hypothetical protein